MVMFLAGVVAGFALSVGGSLLYVLWTDRRLDFNSYDYD